MTLFPYCNILNLKQCSRVYKNQNNVQFNNNSNYFNEYKYSKQINKKIFCSLIMNTFFSINNNSKIKKIIIIIIIIIS